MDEYQMSEGKRPGGLVALAVLNFVFAALGLLFRVLAFTMIALAASGALDDMLEQSGDQQAQADMAQVGDVVTNPAGIWLMVGLSVLGIALAITSGVGYLRQKKFSGRIIGNVYALVAMVNVILPIFFLKGAKFGFDSMIFLVYPLVTLFLINTIFKEDLVR